MLGDILDEIGFKQTIKHMKKQQLLVPFAKDLAARWSEKSQFGSQHDTGSQQDFEFLGAQRQRSTATLLRKSLRSLLSGDTENWSQV
ncbi:hypothetical protein H671_21598, partial [Cricetulus griseus]